MAITGAQMKQAISSISGAATGQIVGWDQLAAGADDAMQKVGCKTVTECALFLATMAAESGFFRTTTEYGTGQSYAPYVGRTFQQVTWNYGYAGFGKWAASQGMITDPNLFVKNPSQLSEMRWAWLGGVWFWTLPRSGTGWAPYKSVIDVARQTGSILAVSRAVNIGHPNTTSTPNGMNYRTPLFEAFKALGASIIPGSKTAPLPTTVQQQTAPKGAVPGTAAMVLKAANDLWNMYKGRLFTYAWPGWRELPYGITSGYWCAAFVSLAFKKGTGFDWKVGLPTSGPAYCPALVAAMTKSQYWTEQKYGSAQAGDVVFFFNSSGTAYHVGLVEAGPSAGGHDMQTIEGNTSTPGLSASMSAGGTLAKKVRDDRYLRMRIFRPTYWAPAPVVQTTQDNDVVEVVEVDTSDAGITTFTVVDAPDMAENPIDLLNVSESFLASLGESSTRWCRVEALIGGVTVVDNLPVVANASKVSVDSGRAWRREATFVIQPDPHDETHQGLKDLLQHPGLELRAEVGFSWGTYHEAVPVFDGIATSTEWDWATGQVTVQAADRMLLISRFGFPKTVNSNPDCSYVDAIRWFITEADPRAQVIDLTGNEEKLPQVVWTAGPSMRIDAINELAIAMGAEVFKSPAPNVYLIRPITRLGSSVKWTTREGQALVSLKEKTDDTKVANHVIATSKTTEREMAGEWWVTDEANPFNVDDFGHRLAFWDTGLLMDREQCEEAAESIVQRLIGSRVSIDFTQLVNPLMEGGDPNRVATRDAQWDVIIDAFEIPLGTQATAGASARSLTTEGVSM